MRHKKSPTTQSTSGEDREPILQFTIRLLGVSPSIWRRILVPGRMTLRELHGAIQIAMGWQGFHLFVFDIRAQRYGSWELSAESPDKGSRGHLYVAGRTAAGSVVPILGNGVGAVGGGVAGTIAGSIVGDKSGEAAAEQYAKARGGC